MRKALDGIVVVEQAGRLAASVCGALLSELGATVVRIERPGVSHEVPALALPGKRRVLSIPGSREETELWRALAQRGDAFVLPPGAASAVARTLIGPRPHAVVCTVSAYGADASAGSNAAADWVIQADCGVMAVTGEAGGPPQATGAPILEMFAGINAATAIVAALRVARRDGAGQSIDISLFDTAFALLGTHAASAVSGKPRGHRVGCGHPLCAPWDVYRCGDAMVQICTASEAQWERFANLIGRSDLLKDVRFSNSGSRVANSQMLNGIIQDWLQSVDPVVAVQRLIDIGIPAAKVERMDDVLTGARARGDVTVIEDGTREHLRMRSVLRMSRSAGVAPATIDLATTNIASVIADLPLKVLASRASSPEPPLSGIRVVEIGPYTSGPLAGRYLCQLGAEVIKVEPPNGEDSRRFQPQFGGVSGFFFNYNWGKSTVALDLGEPEDRRRLVAMLKTSDVVLHNLKAGALERLGIDLRAIGKINRRLISCSISGYGIEGPAQAALDTVIQAQSGLMSLIGDGMSTIKSGFSLADLISAHVATLAVLAALHYRDGAGEGQELDISMLDCLVWILQPAWDAQARNAMQLQTMEAADGYVAAILGGLSKPLTQELQGAWSKETRSEMVDRLRAAGVEAAAILELDEVIVHPCASAGNRLSMLPVAPGITTPVLSSPFRLSLTPAKNGPSIAKWNEQS